jgi:hypothetical protein
VVFINCSIKQIIITLKLLTRRYLASEAPFHPGMDAQFSSEFAHNMVELAFLVSTFAPFYA